MSVVDSAFRVVRVVGAGALALLVAGCPSGAGVASDSGVDWTARRAASVPEDSSRCEWSELRSARWCLQPPDDGGSRWGWSVEVPRDFVVQVAGEQAVRRCVEWFRGASAEQCHIEATAADGGALPRMITSFQLFADGTARASFSIDGDVPPPRLAPDRYSIFVLDDDRRFAWNVMQPGEGSGQLWWGTAPLVRAPGDPLPGRARLPPPAADRADAIAVVVQHAQEVVVDLSLGLDELPASAALGDGRGTARVVSEAYAPGVPPRTCVRLDPADGEDSIGCCLPGELSRKGAGIECVGSTPWRFSLEAR